MTEEKMLMVTAAAEIRALRRENEILRAKVETMDVFALALQSQPLFNTRGAAPDIAWQLDRYVQQADGSAALGAKE